MHIFDINLLTVNIILLHVMVFVLFLSKLNGSLNTALWQKCRRTGCKIKKEHILKLKFKFPNKNFEKELKILPTYKETNFSVSNPPQDRSYCLQMKSMFTAAI